MGSKATRFALAHCNAGKHYFNVQRVAQSVKSHHVALRLAPGFAYVHNDLGNALSDATGRSDEVQRAVSSRSFEHVFLPGKVTRPVTACPKRGL